MDLHDSIDLVDQQGEAYDWNILRSGPRIQVHDETLAVCPQPMHVSQMTMGNKLRSIRLMSEVGVDAMNLGSPSINETERAEFKETIKFILDNGLSIGVTANVKSLTPDVEILANISQRFGIDIEANMFIDCGSSQRRKADGGIQGVRDLVRKSVAKATDNGLRTCVFADSADGYGPEYLKAVSEAAVENGVYSICLYDSTGRTNPKGTVELVRFLRACLAGCGVLIDWYGSNDCGLALANSLVALDAGADRIHATGLGIGERAGNIPMEQLLTNLSMLGIRTLDAAKLRAYCLAISDACNFTIPPSHPIVGQNLFYNFKDVATSMTSVTATTGDELTDLLQTAKEIKEAIPADFKNSLFKPDQVPIEHDQFLSKFLAQRKNLIDMLTGKKEISIGTLGPEGTTSHFATACFIDYLQDINSSTQYETKLFDDFDLVYEALKSETVDMIVIPNAYERITEMYWDSALKNLFSFLQETPIYGIAAKNGQKINTGNRKIRIASCRPVFCLIPQIMKDIDGSGQGYEIIPTLSTTKAAEALLNDEVDYALTNETSIKTSDLEFISTTSSAEVLWSVFSLKNNDSS